MIKEPGWELLKQLDKSIDKGSNPIEIINILLIVLNNDQIKTAQEKLSRFLP
tara:strand:- start:373 stop:528 length:156 start_codon:yes stop_codon:yes gene_type:complete